MSTNKFMGLKVPAIRIDWKCALDELYDRFDEYYLEQMVLDTKYCKKSSDLNSNYEECEKLWEKGLLIGKIIQTVDLMKHHDDIEGYFELLDSHRMLIKQDNFQ